MVEEAIPDYSREISDLSDEVGRLEIEMGKLEDKASGWMDADAVAELTYRVQKIQSENNSLVDLIKGLQEQNHTLFAAIGEIEQNSLNHRWEDFKQDVRYTWDYILTKLGFRTF
jgi:predicted  nucleic acid-binding Zn-ribbon protein